MTSNAPTLSTGLSTGVDAMAVDPPAIDEDLQSRQMAVYGRESMQKLKGANVLITGLNGLGAEIAKNVILANVNSVTLHDAGAASLADCGAHFYLTPADEGKNRAEACARQMQELNPGVKVGALAGAFPMEGLAQYQVVVAVDAPLDLALAVDAACRAASPPIAFIRTDVRGLCGAVFVDLGPSFVCHDPTGEAIKSAIVESVTVEGAGTDGAKLRVQCVDDEALDLDDGDHVTFSELQGMEALNGCAPLKVEDCSKGKKRFALPLPPGAALDDHRTGGLITEVRQPKTLAFKSLHDFLNAPGELWEVDESKMASAATSFSEPFLAVMGSPAANTCFGRSGLLHLAFRALDAYRAAHGGALPPPADAAAADEVLALANQLNAAADADAKVAELDEAARASVVKHLAMGAVATLSPMAAIVGGIVGQEVVKAVTGKFHPTTQGFYFDALECLPTEPPSPADFAPAALGAAGRYAAQAAVFGAPFVQKLSALNVFLVGSGALGCEFLKNLALMGVACGAGGKLTVTDDDIIEKSNLSRQFLFRNHNVGHSKSSSAVEAVSKMNPQLNAVALQDRVAPTTEGTFDDNFWEGLDVVVNALDNIKARLYVDSRCVFFGKPLLESGTLGTKCNTQMVIPHWTENYGASRDPPEKEAPACALHNFPHNIDHCLVLGHSEFVGNFETQPADATDFLAKGGGWVDGMRGANESDATILEKLRGDQKTLCGMSGGVLDLISPTYRSASWEGCVGWARRKFESYFASRIKQLLHNCPPDMKTQTGVPFWSPPKRLPKPLAFDAADPLHMQFVVAAANLRAFALGVAPPADCRDAAAVAALLASSAECVVPPFTPTADLTIETGVKEEDERRKALAEAQSSPEGQAAAIAAAVDELTAAKASLPGGFAPKANEFEKDDDTNHHMDFISAVGNLRVRCAILGQFWRNHAAITAQFSDTASITPLRRATTGSRRSRSSRRS